jgi:protein-L-isoaspartate O-methyltransferase
MEDGVFYHNDIFSSRILVRILRRYLRTNALEVGAGIGAITLELSRFFSSVVALEPHPVLYASLTQRVGNLPNIITANTDLSGFIASPERESDQESLYESIVYINVLEHIADDISELRLARSQLSANGRVLIVVPAHKWLYANVDRLTGHHRRYSRRQLQDAISESGLQFEMLHYFDVVGLLPYLFLYKILGGTSTGGVNAAVYSRIVMPLSLLLYFVSRGRLIGKNLIAVATLPKS